MEQFCALLAVAMRRHMWVKVQGIKHRCAHALTHTFVHAPSHTGTHTPSYTMHAYILTHMCVHTLPRMHAHTPVHICMDTPSHTCVCMSHMHAYTLKHTRAHPHTYVLAVQVQFECIRGLQQRQVPGIAVVCHRQGRGIKDERWRVPFVSCGPVNYLETLMGFPPRCHLHFLLEFTFGDAVARNLAQDRDRPNPLMCV